MEKVRQMKKKILFLILSLYNGGAEKSLVNLLNELDPQKYDVDLMLFRKEGIFLEQLPEHINIVDPPKNILKLYEKADWRHISAIPLYIYKMFATFISNKKTNSLPERNGYRWTHFYEKVCPKVENHYDVVIPFTSGEIAYFAADKIDAKKYITWVHNDYRNAKHTKKYDEKCFEKMNVIASISDECVNILKEEFPLYKDKFVTIPNISSSNVTRKRAKEFMPKEYDSLKGIKILSIGRLTQQKGFDIAIDAAYKLKEKGIDFQWFIIGDGGLEQELKSQAAALGLKEMIFLGTRSNPYPYIDGCDILVQSSRFEGKSVVLDEAKIIAKPVVVTNYQTVRDQIIDGKEGIIVDMNAHALSEGIIRMIEDRSLYNHIHEYLSAHEYGNQEVIIDYYNIID